MSVSGDRDRPAEPTVLAMAKQHLFPGDVEHAYAVTDTQFAQPYWRSNAAIDDRTRSILAPFNHVRLGSGYPDLVGVGRLEPTVATGTSPDDAPLIAVEAKGYAGGEVDVETGIAQAYDRLSDVNVAFLAAPSTAISASARSMARTLNVGILAATPEGTVEPLEIPRVVGASAPEASRAIRFQATAQGVANQSFGLNHPKNYLAYPLAHYHPDPTEAVMERYVVGAVNSARSGAAFLGLVTERLGGMELTDLGREVIRFALAREGSVDAAIRRFEEWQRSRDRFVESAGEWGTLARFVLYRYPATELLISELQRLHDQGHSNPTLPELVLAVFEEHPTFAVEIFIRGSDEARTRVFRDETTLDREALSDGNVYASPTVFQLKAMLYHVGILTERGAEPNRLSPEDDVWQLCNPV